METITLRDRFQGVMIGTLAGDAIGAPYENKKAAHIAEDIERRGGLALFDYTDPWQGKRQMRAGQPTDDSELAACLGLSLVEYPLFNPVDAYHRMRSFIHDRTSVLTTEEAYGSGGTLRAALAPPTYAESCLLFEQGKIPLVPSNGSLMRNQAIALCCFGNIDDVIDFAWRQSCLTHQHPVAQASCVVYAVMMAKLLDGYPSIGAWKKTRHLLLEHEYRRANPIVSEILSAPMFLQPNDENIWPLSGGAFISLWVALWAVLSATSFRDGIARAVSVGGDVDTYAAIAGGLLGARYGVKNIPLEWREALIGRSVMEKIGNDLHDINNLRNFR